jgi:glycosyltransferase involved in cell wall biosynthesis
MTQASAKNDGLFYVNARFLNQPLTGVQRYCFEMLNALDELIDPGQAIALCPAPLINGPDFKNIRIQIGPRMNGNLWEQLYLPWKTRGALLFSPANVGPYFKKRQIVSMHDMSVFACPDAYTARFRFKYRLLFKRLAKSAGRILTVSEFSKREIQKYLGVPPEKITVTYEGREHMERIAADDRILDRLNLDAKPYFLVVGSFSQHKNLQVLLAANALLDQTHYQIVVVGADNAKVFNPAPFYQAQNVVTTATISDGELKTLYQHAAALVFPSLYEGFGLPLLEAMACGSPVLCADIPSSREVCADVALYFDPYSADELAEEMTQMLKQPDVGNRLRESGRQQARAFSWKLAAKRTFQIISQIEN